MSISIADILNAARVLAWANVPSEDVLAADDNHVVLLGTVGLAFNRIEQMRDLLVQEERDADDAAREPAPHRFEGT